MRWLVDVLERHASDRALAERFRRLVTASPSKGTVGFWTSAEPGERTDEKALALWAEARFRGDLGALARLFYATAEEPRHRVRLNAVTLAGARLPRGGAIVSIVSDLRTAILFDVAFELRADATAVASRVRRCANTACDQGQDGPRFFYREGGKNTYCSPTCSNRARQRAHYQRLKEYDALTTGKDRTTNRRER